MGDVLLILRRSHRFGAAAGIIAERCREYRSFQEHRERELGAIGRVECGPTAEWRVSGSERGGNDKEARRGGGKGCCRRAGTGAAALGREVVLEDQGVLMGNAPSGVLVSCGGGGE
jgi:hypothetical protein